MRKVEFYMKKKRKFPIITFILSLCLLSIAYYNYVNVRAEESEIKKQIYNIKSSGQIREDFLTKTEKEELEKQKQKEEKKKRKEEEKKKKAEKKAKEKAERKAREKAEKEAKIRAEREKELASTKRKEKQEKKIPEKIILDIEPINQLPELRNGCEVTSLAMLLRYNGVNIDKMTLANKVKKDATTIEYDKYGNIVKWGDPDEGFVGDITGKDSPGYSINPKPLMPLMEKYIMPKPVDLTKSDYKQLEEYLSMKRPVIVWITSDFSMPSKDASWMKGNKVIEAHFNQHAVLLTGYDKNYVYYNDPLTESKNSKVDKETFKKIWNSMGSRALSYTN
ncbi:hypothetical protein UT300018_28270 [Clostridium faecium]